MTSPIDAIDEEALVLGQNQPTFDALQRMVGRHTDNFWVRSPVGGQQLVLLSPDDAREVLVRRYKAHAKGRTFANMKLLMGNGLIVQEGDFWRRQRRMMQPLFYDDVLLRSARVMRRHALELRRAWERSAAAGSPVAVTRDVSRTALDTLLECIFGDDLARLGGGQGNPFAMLVDEAARDLSLVPRFRRAARGVDDVVRFRMRHDRFPPDLLSMLMLARDRVGEAMTVTQIRDEVATLVVAGHETTAALLAWSWHEIAKDAAVEARIHEEVDTHDLAGSEPSSMPRLPFLKKVVLEVLRLYPPVWLEDRVTLDDATISGQAVPRGTEVFIPIYFLHRSPAHFASPNRFDPDRFSGNDIDPRYADPKGAEAAAGTCPSRSAPSAFMPFSLGPRRCIGDQFAILNAQVHLGVIAQTLTLRPVEAAPLRIVPHVNLRPEGDGWMLPTRGRPGKGT